VSVPSRSLDIIQGSSGMLKPSVQVREEDGVLTAEFWDCLRLDPAPVTDLRKAFEDFRKRTGRAELVVDLNGVAFAGSAALGGFLAMRRSEARLIFCNVDPNVREVFRVSKLDPLFHFALDKPAALAMANSAEMTLPLVIPGRAQDGNSGAGPLRRKKNS
jgi:anti-anti-sigma factor